jgi:D-alanine--poly(phosphoribitol) ligase subunit 1
MQYNVLDYFDCPAFNENRNKVAIRHNEQSITYFELKERAQQFSLIVVEYFRKLGAEKSIRQPIAVALPKSIELVVADLGITYSGNVFTNLDMNSPDDRLTAIRDHLDILLIITNTEGQARFLKAGWPAAQLISIDNVNDIVTDQTVKVEQLNLSEVIDVDPYCIINTSGSTGVPKGVAISHRGVIDFIDWVTTQFEFGPGDIIGNLSPLFFDIYLLELHVCIAKGSTLVLLADELPMFPVTLLSELQEKEVNFIFWVPTVMVNIANLDLLERFDMTNLKRIFFAGEVFPMKQLNYWRAKLPTAIFVNLYGPIEVTVDCTYYILDREFEDDDPLPIGYPCRNTDILILGGDGRIVERPGDHGELCVRGSSLALGYWNDNERTATAFMQNPADSRYPDRIYRTGDIVFRDEEGLIFFAGRIDHQIKHLGFRIDLSEIEHVVINQSTVDNACVIYDQKRKAIILVYEARSKLTTKELFSLLKNKLPRYMIPKIFHRIGTLPRNANGKVDRRLIEATYVEG